MLLSFQKKYLPVQSFDVSISNKTWVNSIHMETITIEKSKSKPSV